MKETQRRFSKQRALVLEAVKASKNHPTAEDIYALVKRESPGISLGTVYRNLNLLTELGEIINLSQGMGGDHFDGVCSNHPHLICTHCQNVFDLAYDIIPLSEAIVQQAAATKNANVHCVRVAAFGLCAQCRKKQSR